MTTLQTPLLWDALRSVIDPELGCNLVDLGLIYDLEVRDAKVIVTMTLTTPGCPMHDSIAQGVQWALLEVEGVQDAEVAVVWDPPWSPAMMTAAGRAACELR
jgi:metal-sulfur cluster biosynthetic enzyme